MNDLVELLAAVYSCLGGLSIRSLIYSIEDVYVRAELGDVDWEKVLEILAQNLAGTLKMSPSAAKEVIREAITCRPKLHEGAPTLAIGSVGDEKAPTLAHLVNRHVPVDATPRVKLEVVRRLGLPRDRILRSYSRVVGRGEGWHVRGAVKSLRGYIPGTPFADVDLIRTATAFRRKLVMNMPISDFDIFIREYSRTADKPVYIALDVSGSMKEYMWGDVKLRVAKNAVARYLRQMASLRGRVSLLLFNVDADFMWTPYEVHKYLREMLEILEHIYAGGGTELASALEVLYSYGVREAVLITDGKTADVEKTWNLVKKFKRLHAVAVEKSDLLKQIAKATGGKYQELSPKLDMSVIHD